MKGVATFWCVFQLQTYEAITKRMIGSCLNSQVSSWFCRTKNPIIYPWPVFSVAVSQNCFKVLEIKGLTLKFYFWQFGDIRSNRKLNIKSVLKRKYFFYIWHRWFGARWKLHLEMTWRIQISLATCYFLAIYTLFCRKPASTGVNFFETWLLILA